MGFEEGVVGGEFVVWCEGCFRSLNSVVNGVGNGRDYFGVEYEGCGSVFEGYYC